MGNLFREHPKKIAELIFSILTTFDLLGGAWAFFSSTPPFHWLTERWPSMTTELYGWLKLIIHLCMLGVLVEILRQQYRKTRKHNPQVIPHSIQAPTRTSTLDLPSLTTDRVLKLVNDIKPFRKFIKIKIISSQEHLKFATTLAGAFDTAGYTFEINHETDKKIFSAKTEHNKFLIYYPQTDNEKRTTICLFLSGCLMFPPIFPLTHYPLEQFPKESTRDYLQIEIGGAP
jgi:hypothetical protein